MDAQHNRWRSRIVSRVSIVAVVSALLCTMVGTRSESVAHLEASRVVLTAAIDQSSTTLGFADSDLTNTGMSQAEIAQQLDKMQSLGVQNVRILIPWVTIEERQGEYNWDYVDYIVEAANSRGMGILGVINQTPGWAGIPIMAGMPDPDVFGGFAEKVATRYAGKISAYEIWNEPNAINSLDPVDPAAYTRLLQAAYPLMKQVDPTITVVGGVVGAGATLGHITMNPDDFVQGMYDAGAKGYFDALSFHPYQYSVEFSAGAGVAGSPLEQLQQIMQIMAANGDADLKVWATEYGQPTTGQNTAQQQAEFIRDFLNTWSQMAGTGPMFIYTLQDTNSGSPNLQDNFGVYYSDGTAKQVVQVIVDYLNSVDPTDPTDPIDPTPAGPSHPLIQAIAAAVHWLGAATRTVITGLATAAVDVAKFTGAVIRAVVQVACNLIRSGAAAVESVVKGIATATKKAVTTVRQVVHPNTSRTPGGDTDEPVAGRAAKNTALALGGDLAPAEQRVVRTVRPADAADADGAAPVVPGRDETPEPVRAEVADEADVEPRDPDPRQTVLAADDEDEEPSRSTAAERRAALGSSSEDGDDVTDDRTSSSDKETSANNEPAGRTPSTGTAQSNERSEAGGADSSE